MQLPTVLGAGAALAALGWLASALQAPPTRSGPTEAAGHYVLVVEGDRTQLAITHAAAKVDPWAGIATGFASDWLLTIRGEGGVILAEVPLDVTAFATEPQALGKPVQVTGCIVRDPRIGMLVNAPRFAAATSYTFTRREGKATIELGSATSVTVRELAGDAR